MKRFLLGFGVLAALIAPSLSTNAYACSCIGTPSSATALSQSDAVFSGQVVSLDMFRVRIRVDKVWKGETRSEITMLTGAIDFGNGGIGMNSCQYSYRAGETYVIFATGKPDQLQAGVCSGTAIASASKIQGLDAVVPHKKVGDEVRACSSSSPPNAATGEIRVVTATPEAQALPAVTLAAEGSGRKYGALTDRSGKSIFSGLQAGDYKLTASADGRLAKQSIVSVKANACVEASLYLLPITKQKP